MTRHDGGELSIGDTTTAPAAQFAPPVSAAGRFDGHSSSKRNEPSASRTGTSTTTMRSRSAPERSTRRPCRSAVRKTSASPRAQVSWRARSAATASSPLRDAPRSTCSRACGPSSSQTRRWSPQTIASTKERATANASGCSIAATRLTDAPTPRHRECRASACVAVP